MQSDTGDIFRQVKHALEDGREVLFTSTPCQVAGLKAYLDRDYANLITCDFVCHGVPSPELFRSYVHRKFDALGRTDASDYTFRDLANWGYHCALKFPDGESVFETYSDEYMQPFLAGLNFREGCYQCSFAQERRCADITIGDFWGVGNCSVNRARFAQGVSLILVNSVRGQELLLRCADGLTLERYPWWTLADNGQLHSPSRRPRLRDSFYKDYGKLSPGDFAMKYGLVQISRRSIIRRGARLVRDFVKRSKRCVNIIRVCLWRMNLRKEGAF